MTHESLVAYYKDEVGMSDRAANDLARSAQKSMAQMLENVLSRTAAKIEREIQFQRRGLPATVPAWASEIASDKTVTNLRSVLKGLYLTAMIRDEKHAGAHHQKRMFCSHCIAVELGGSHA